ncbi:hypothetical protein LMG31506_02292 [Cupriavidus yeoncheonensis]|uniref:Uncharacterized protein n=1 Tax=Cupriavidus yeoncheonensis TaxID=1462994 RepID=A0A916IUB2_9BURK|nr:hypothetical protein [Cupriavidus yeoncheonensis]CAG2140319.1 hypothetical protein LMG31506_02292 [Cupriavidus yeoncheonensis]
MITDDIHLTDISITSSRFVPTEEFRREKEKAKIHKVFELGSCNVNFGRRTPAYGGATAMFVDGFAGTNAIFTATADEIFTDIHVNNFRVLSEPELRQELDAAEIDHAIRLSSFNVHIGRRAAAYGGAPALFIESREGLHGILAHGLNE